MAKKNGHREHAEDNAVEVITSAPATDAPATEAVEQPEQAAPAESAADVTARLKAAVLGARSNEDAAAASLKDAREASSVAEHALCEHLKATRGGKLSNVEVEVGGVRYKPKFFGETNRYRLDRVLQHERVTV